MLSFTLFPSLLRAPLYKVRANCKLRIWNWAGKACGIKSRPRIFSPTFIHFIHFHPCYPLSFTFIQFYPTSSTFIHFHPLSSTFIHFIHFHSLSSLFIQFHPFLSTFIHVHPKLDTGVTKGSALVCFRSTYSNLKVGWDRIGIGLEISLLRAPLT